MKYRYIGAGDTPPEQINFFGYEFKLNGEPVDVEGLALEKVENHKCFKVVLERAKKADKQPVKKDSGD